MIRKTLVSQVLLQCVHIVLPLLSIHVTTLFGAATETKYLHVNFMWILSCVIFRWKFPNEINYVNFHVKFTKRHFVCPSHEFHTKLFTWILHQKNSCDSSFHVKFTCRYFAYIVLQFATHFFQNWVHFPPIWDCFLVLCDKLSELWPLL